MEENDIPEEIKFNNYMKLLSHMYGLIRTDYGLLNRVIKSDAL